MTTPIPPAIAEVPYNDADALEKWIIANPGRVTPLAAERLLEHSGFRDIGTMPTSTGVRCAVWQHVDAGKTPQLARFQVLVYHTETLNRASVSSVLTVLRQYRAWKLRFETNA